MPLVMGVVGEPGSGRSTIFDALQAAPGGEQFATGPGGTRVRTVQVEDPRLDLLASVHRPKRVTPLSMRFVDFEGKSRKGEERIAHLREMDGFLIVVRGFPLGSGPAPNPEGQERSILEEWLLCDMEAVDKRLRKLEKTARPKEARQERMEQAILLKIQKALESGRGIREIPMGPQDEKMVRGFAFLSQKPYRVVWNMGEADIPPPVISPEGPIRIRGQVQKEIAELSGEERETFLGEMGVENALWGFLPKACLDVLGVVTFFTVVGEEIRAWTIPRGGTALEAAGRIHADMARGFVRAEVLAYVDLAAEKGPPRPKRKGRLEGRDYIVQEGDILTIRFSP